MFKIVYALPAGRKTSLYRLHRLVCRRGGG
jgi:hypothetical protein